MEADIFEVTNEPAACQWPCSQVAPGSFVSSQMLQLLQFVIGFQRWHILMGWK